MRDTDHKAIREAESIIKERNRMLRDAYYGRNGLSMTPAQREAYAAMVERAKEARRIMQRMGTI